MDKIRLLVIAQEDPEEILGGMGRHIGELYKEMAKRNDIEIDMLVGGSAEGPYWYNGYRKHHCDKLLCYKPGAPNMASLLVSDIQLAKTLLRLVHQGKKWDLIHVHEWNGIQVARMARDAFRIPMVGTMHLCITALMEFYGIIFQEEDIYCMQQEGHLIIDTDEIILCSKAYEKMARQVFMTDRPINLIYNGIDLDEWKRDNSNEAQIRENFQLSDRPIALYVGRIALMKGIMSLLAAIQKEDTGFCHVLVGEVNSNTEKEKKEWYITRWIQRLEKKYPERIKWVGFQQDEALKGLYSLADVGIMPSIHEPFGIVALEHMAMGVPLISTEVEGLKEVVCDEDGNEYSLIIDSENNIDIIEALKFLYGNEAALKELKELGLKRVKDFSWKTASDKTVEIYRRLLK